MAVSFVGSPEQQQNVESRLAFEDLGLELYISWPTLQMFIGIHRVPIDFSAISMEKGCKNDRETLYSTKGFPTTYTIFPSEEYRVPLVL